ncbi:MAG: hypothetical protein K2F83_07615 [Oscillospiraceae bacterium]|nr:hypothetical protein [Oscillospiraceae bacterium]
MDEQNKNFTGEDQAAKEPEVGPISPPVTYATPMKRLWAWVGLVYAVGYALLVAYALAHAGFPIGIGELLIAPALAGLGGSVILRFREGKGRGGLAVCIILSGICFVLALWNLILGLPVLLAQL